MISLEGALREKGQRGVALGRNWGWRVGVDDGKGETGFEMRIDGERKGVCVVGDG